MLLILHLSLSATDQSARLCTGRMTHLTLQSTSVRETRDREVYLIQCLAEAQLLTDHSSLLTELTRPLQEWH